MRLPMLIRLAASLLLATAGLVHADEKAPKRVDDALLLMKHLEPLNNKYVFGGNQVTFGPGAEMKADCSGFLNALLKHSDGFDAERVRAVFGSARPTAKRYFDAIVDGRRFANIEKVENVQAGDILAIAYVKNYKGKATGHVMLAAGKSQSMAARGPVIAETTQWEVPVIDSAINGHGPQDTRVARAEDGAKNTGVGKGVLRVYADREGKVAGYTWSSTSGDKGSFYAQEDRPLVIGRLTSGGREP